MLSKLVAFILAYVFSFKSARLASVILLCAIAGNAQTSSYSLYLVSTGTVPDTTVVKNYTDSLFHQAGNTFTFIGKVNPRRYSAWWITESIPAMLKDTAALKANIDSKASAASVSSLAASMIPYTDTMPGRIMTKYSTAQSINIINATMSGKFNAPTGSTSQYLRGDGSVATFPAIPAAVDTAPLHNQIAANTTAINLKQPQLSGTGFVKTSGTAIAYDNSTYLTGNQTITLSGDVAGSGATAIMATLASTGTAGTYDKVTTDAKGRVTSGYNPVINGAVTRSLNTAFTVSTSQEAFVCYSVQISVTLALTSLSGTVTLQYSTNGGSSYVSLPAVAYTPPLAGLGLITSQIVQVNGFIPANALVKITTATVSGVSYAIQPNGQERY